MALYGCSSRATDRGQRRVDDINTEILGQFISDVAALLSQRDEGLRHAGQENCLMVLHVSLPEACGHRYLRVLAEPCGEPINDRIDLLPECLAHLCQPARPRLTHLLDDHFIQRRPEGGLTREPKGKG